MTPCRVSLEEAAPEWAGSVKADFQGTDGVMNGMRGGQAMMMKAMARSQAA